MITSDAQRDSTVRALQLRTAADAANLQNQINLLDETQSNAAAIDTNTIPLLNQMVRNSDHNHSVNTWFEPAPSGDDKENECANVYVFAPLASISISDAAIGAGSSVLTSPDQSLFTAEMVGRWVIIEGAGTDGAKLGAKITAYTSAGEVTIDRNAATAVSQANARINLQKLTHTNKLNAPAETVNAALKDEAHTGYAANISDPDWQKSGGSVRLGSDNIVAYPFGYFAPDGTTFVPLHQLFPGRKVFVRLNAIRANPYVKVPGRLFFGIYNNNENFLDFVRGGTFSVSASITGTPATTTGAAYVVVIETQSGGFIVSNELTVADAPDAAALDSKSASVRLRWTNFDGAINVRIYRKFAGENYYLLEQSPTIAGAYTDTNNPLREDTGSSVFPVFTNQTNGFSSYWATSENELDELSVLGEPWQPIKAFLPFVSSVNLADVFDPHLVIGLTEPLATLLEDVATSAGSGAVSSGAGIFSAGIFDGKDYILTNQATGATVTGTTAFTDANTLTLSNPPTWDSNDSVLEIADSQPRGIFYDLVGASVMDSEAEWAFHVEDNNRPQTVAANPNGSTQGSPTGGTGDGGGIGGIRCVLDSMMIKVRGADNFTIFEKRADEVLLTDLIWDGFGYENGNFSTIKWIRKTRVKQVNKLSRTDARPLFCTKTHRLITSVETLKSGTAVKSLAKNKKSLHFRTKSFNLESISAFEKLEGDFIVVSFGLKKKRKNSHLMIVNDWLSHNRKDETGLENF